MAIRVQTVAQYTKRSRTIVTIEIDGSLVIGSKMTGSSVQERQQKP